MLCQEASSSVVDASSLSGLIIDGRHSVACDLKRPDGSIDIFVVTQAGRWPQAQTLAEPEVPSVNYTASLHTTESNLARDIAEFRAVVNSISIEDVR